MESTTTRNAMPVNTPRITWLRKFAASDGVNFDGSSACASLSATDSYPFSDIAAMSYLWSAICPPPAGAEFPPAGAEFLRSLAKTFGHVPEIWVSAKNTSRGHLAF
eukprot:3934153-Rhodomonas_salina.1